MSTVRWLHISDLHLNTPGVSSAFLRDELPKFLARSGISCEYVFCTGDLRDARQGVFPSDKGQFLGDICAAVGTPHLFITPGNHDINRGDVGGERDAAVRRILSYYRSDMGIIKPEDMDILYGSEEEFRAYISNVLPAERISHTFPHFNIETEHFNILHVDSTLTYTVGHEANMVLGTSHLYDAINTINKDKPTVLLTHYAYPMLAQEERKMVRELLYRSGIQLWLAGHEHEHNLQPISYLHSIQSGELRLEDRCNTSVLVGEFDTETYSGKIRAYAWFSEGWYPYPAVWHGLGKDDEYPFALRSQEGGELRSFEVINSHNHNKKYKRHYAFLAPLFADIEKDGTVYQGTNGLLDCANEAWAQHEKVVLIADGGMGKTTQLLSACDALDGVAAVYIPLESIEPDFLVRDVCRALFASSSEDALYQLTKNRHTKPDVYLFLDGMNEVDANQEKKLIEEIRRMARTYPGMQIVISSRSNFTERYRLDRFSLARIKPLREEQIKSLFTEREWEKVENNLPLRKLVQNPLLATMYKRMLPEVEKGKALFSWVEDIENETELIYDYYITQMSLSVSKDSRVVQYIQRCLPFIAFSFERQARHTMPMDVFRVILKQAAELEIDGSVDNIQRVLRVRSADPISDFDLEDYLLNVSHLMYVSDGKVSFPHQIHRDYLSSVWLTKAENMLQCWSERVFTTTVANHIRVLSGERYWDGIASDILELARNREDCRDLIINVINTFPYTERSGKPDFSGLDLRGIRIPDYSCSDEAIKLAGTMIDEYSIGCETEEVVLLKGLAFSPDNEYLAGVSDSELIVYSMETGVKVFRTGVYTYSRQIGYACARFSSDTRFLFVRNNQDLIIFAKAAKGWKRTGEVSGVYVKKLHNAIIHDDILSLYYNNRIENYSIGNAELVERIQEACPYENVAEGEDIASIKPTVPPGDVDQLTAVISDDEQYTAVCYQDGRLIVYYKGGKVLHNLEMGKGVLMTAAISKDGNRAVTLSANTYANRRRAQLWDLDSRRKVDERFCSASTKTVCLTDHGEWIIGNDDRGPWFWNWENAENQFRRGERFISEAERGITTYGNCLLYQTGDGTLMELDLDSQNSRPIGKYPPIHFATTLQNGEIAVVGHADQYVEFKSTTTGKNLKINRERAKIQNIHAFKAQPFIAVLTAGGTVSMYHVGNGSRTRILHSAVGYRLVAFHPDQNVFSFSDGNRRLQTFRYFEWNDGKYGKWCEPRCPEFNIDGKIIAIGFNTTHKEQIMIETNGKITYMQDRFCDFHSQTKVITNFGVGSYDFSGVVCSDEVKEQLIMNGADA